MLPGPAEVLVSKHPDCFAVVGDRLGKRAGGCFPQCCYVETAYKLILVTFSVRQPLIGDMRRAGNLGYP